KPLGEKEIIARRDDLNRRIEAIQKDLLKEQRGVYSVRKESQYETELPQSHLEKVQQLRQDNRDIESALRDLSQAASDSPTFQPIADKAEDLADRELQHSAKEVSQAEKETKAPLRDRQLQNTDQELASAIQKLEEMRRQNDQVAQAQLDQMKL